VTYASSQRLGCYLETLARFRADLTLYAELREIAGEDDFLPLGHVPISWAALRMLGTAEHAGRYADLYGSEWIGILRRELAVDSLELGVADIDAAVLQWSIPRTLTQRVSRLVFRRGFDGIHYRSRYGHDIRNWALFEPFKLSPRETVAVDLDDADLAKALAIHRLRIG
jgi:RES domain